MRTALIVSTMLLALAGAARADESLDREALAAAREEVRRAREELGRATRELTRLAGEEARARQVQLAGLQPRPILGIVMGRGDGGGVRLDAVTPGGPAEKAGLASGDVVTAIDAEPLDARDPVRQARELLDGMEAGDRYVLTVRAPDGETREVEVAAALHHPVTSFSFVVSEGLEPLTADARELGAALAGGVELDAEALRAELGRLREGVRAGLPVLPGREFAEVNVWRHGFGWSGLELASLNEGLGRYFGVSEGALVLEAENLEGTDLLPGDVILAVSSRPVTGPKEVMRELRRYQPGEVVTVEVVRDGRPIEVDVTAPDAPGDGFFYEFRTEEHEGP